MRAVSVRVNEVIGVAGYVLPGTHVDVVATVSPTSQAGDMTSKVILTNVLVLAAGTKIEQSENNKPMPVSVVTMLVTPEEAERLTLASGEGKIQLALRNPLDKESPVTRGITAGRARRCPDSARRHAHGRRQLAGRRVVPSPAPAPEPATVEISVVTSAREVATGELNHASRNSSYTLLIAIVEVQSSRRRG
jgi:pilus assembly protein CpaB